MADATSSADGQRERGRALVATLDGQAKLTMLLVCYALFGVSLIASIIVITLIWSRDAHHPMPSALLVPTLWIVLGPLASRSPQQTTSGCSD